MPSRRVSQLERRLGVRLLTRTTRKVALTEVGAVYRRQVQGLLDELASASREASDAASEPQGLVWASIPATFGRQWIAPLLPGFLERHPKIRAATRPTDSLAAPLSDPLRALKTAAPYNLIQSIY